MPFLTLPLNGTHLIEASAGTGKTFTLATLVTRLVVEQGLRIGQVLAVTFTEAATQELRKRIGERLALAARLVETPQAKDEAPDAAISRAIINAHLQASGEAPAKLTLRLQQAVDEIDLAAIFTIHGFCARVLREHALESGQTFAAPELLPNSRALFDELAADLWRNTAASPADVPLLMQLWKEGPASLARDLASMTQHATLLPPKPSAPVDLSRISAELQRAAQALAQGFAQHGAAFFNALAEAVNAKVLNGASYKLAWIQPLQMEFAQWCAAGDWAALAPAKLSMLQQGALEEKTNKGQQGRTPQSPLSALIQTYLAATQDFANAQELACLSLLHTLREQANLHLAKHKQQLRVQTYDDLIDGVATALAGAHAQILVQRLRAQYAVALVDEFQDTDARQWDIFRTVFGDSAETQAEQLTPALFLIGDPKQAIYGFRGGDVQTYLLASRQAQAAPPLSHNFRSRPSVLAAIEALYTQAGDKAFWDERIAFHHVSAGTKRVDADYQRGGGDAPALTLWQVATPPIDEKGKRKPYSAQHARELATQACVAAIHAVLSEARAGTALICNTPVQPSDIAVLVRKHDEATRIQRALAAVGIPAVAAGKQSLFETTEARELLTLLTALLHTTDESRLRAALATVLLGLDAAGIAALQTDATAQRQWHISALRWRERWQRGGPLALVSDLCADNAERLLGLLDGERRLTNYLQLGELLQQANTQALGLHGLVDWLAQQIAQADTNDDTQLLRLESDARRVQIVTLHKSKGLEYPLVFLPFVGIGSKPPDPGHACVITGEDGSRALQWKLQQALSGWDAARSAWVEAQRAEDARLLYVGLTRAEHALWIATGDFYNARTTALAPMLDGLATSDSIVCDTTQPPATLPWLAPVEESQAATARYVTRQLAPDWWVYSFTQLTHADSGTADLSSQATVVAAGGNDEPQSNTAEAATQPRDDVDPRFMGNRFGVVLHEVLENGDFAAWRNWQPTHVAPASERKVIEEALKKGGYAKELLQDGVAVLTTLVGQTLNVLLPEGTRLCDIPAGWRRAEIEFQFALKPTAVHTLLALLHAHGISRERQGFSLRRTLEGLMTGLIDLTYCHDGRWYVLDYKSNQLPAYDAEQLQRAMTHSEYDLQALIYTLALHRWLRFKLGDAYCYERDFGGIRYVFCRGLDATRKDSPGIYAQRFAPELIHALDALFAGNTQEAAA